MFRRTMLFITLLCALTFSAACGNQSSTPTPVPAANMANPASVFCEKNGGKIELATDATGAVSGTCVFADQSRCDEWAFFRGECKPGEH